MRKGDVVCALALVRALIFMVAMFLGLGPVYAQGVNSPAAPGVWARFGAGFGIDNDVLARHVRSSRWGDNTDRYYTSGEGAHGFVRLEGGLLRLSGFTEFIEWRVAQVIFTPEAFEAPVPDPRDRQYAAAFTGAISYAFASPQMLVRGTFETGMLGPSALGEEFQNYFHRNVAHKPEARGWAYQLSDRWVANAGVDLLYRLPLFSGPAAHASLVFNVSATAGNYIVQAAAGASFRVGFGGEVYRFGRPQIARGTPGSLITPTSVSRPWHQWFGVELFGSVRGLATAYDATLDEGRRVERVPLGGCVSLGVDALLARYVVLSYELSIQSAEFTAQDGAHAFGTAYASFVWRAP